MEQANMDLSAFVGKLLVEQDGDVLRERIRVLSQVSMEMDVAGLLGAGRRTESRAGLEMQATDGDVVTFIFTGEPRCSVP